MFKSLRSQYLLGGLFVLTTLLTLLLWNAQRLVHEALEARYRAELEIAGPVLGAALAPLLASRDYVGAQELLAHGAEARHLAFVELRDPGERLLASSGDARQPGLRSADHEIALAGQHLGRLRLGVDAQAQRDAQHALLRDGLLIGAGLLALGLLMLSLWARWIGAGLGGLVRASDRVGAGLPAPELPETGPAELARVGRALNQLSATVEAQRRSLRDAAQLRRALVASMPGGLLVFDAQGRLRHCSAAARRMLGLPVEKPADEVELDREEPLAGPDVAAEARLAQALGEALRPEDRPWARALRTGLPQREVLLPCQCADSETRWISVNAEPCLHAGDAQPAAVVCSLNDISQHVQGEQTLRALSEGLEARIRLRTAELEEARQLAERTSRAKSQFLSRMSHELRTPLNAILGFAQLLAMSHERLRAAEREKIAQIERAGWHLLELINDVLDLSRIEAGEMSTELEPVEVGELLGETAQMLASLAAQQAVQLAIADAAPAWVRADRKRLRQVLNNLISNGIKYNRAGGTVWVQAEALADEQVRITVRDSGRGMSAEQLAELYRPFVRFERGEGEAAGTGIGLVITKRLVELMGGTIEASSQPGQGSSFAVVLPACRAPAPAPSAPSQLQSTAAALQRHRLLYIEDDAANAEVLRSLMADDPRYELSIAADGATGLEKLRSLQPDLMLIDIELPGMDGVEVCTRVRADARDRELPLIALSANAMPAEVRRALAAGFDRYVTKPVDFPVLLRQIDELLARRRPGSL